MKIKVLRSISTTDGLLIEGTTPNVKDSLARMLIKRGYAEEAADEQPKEADTPDEIKPLPQRKPRKSRK